MQTVTLPWHDLKRNGLFVLLNLFNYLFMFYFYFFVWTGSTLHLKSRMKKEKPSRDNTERNAILNLEIVDILDKVILHVSP